MLLKRAFTLLGLLVGVGQLLAYLKFAITELAAARNLVRQRA